MRSNRFVGHIAGLTRFALALWACTAAACADDTPTQFDLILRGGRIVDGTGNPWFVGDIAVRNDRIVAIGARVTGEAERVIEADGLTVAPGFIDIHSHSDFPLLTDGHAHSKIRQGVTTEILGEGSSAGPYEGKLAAPGVTVGGDVERWHRLGDYFDLVERRGIAVNVASYVGIGNVWRCVMGESFERPTSEQIAEMQRLVREAMEDGALGLSSQVMMPPGSLATTDDIVALAEAVRPFGGIYSTHIRNEGTGVFESVAEAIEIGRRAGVPVDVIHIKIADQQYWGRMGEVVAMIEEARREGVNVQANVYPYTRGNNNLVSIIPPWAHEGGTDELLARLRDPELRERLKTDIRNGLPGWYNHYTAVGGDWSRMLISDNSTYKGLTMDRVIAMRSESHPDVDPLDELFQILLDHNGSVSTVYAHHTDEDMQLALQQEWCSIGSDGSALAVDGPLRRGNPHPRNFGTFPRVLGVYVRELEILSLPTAVRKMTSQNALKVGIVDRGLLRPGMFADITVFDADTIIDQATYTDPFHYPIGVKYVIVNGRVVLDNEQPTDEFPGRALRQN